MAASSSTSLSLPVLHFLSPPFSTPRRRLSLSRNPSFFSGSIRTCRIRASKDERPAAVIERVNGLELKTTNGAVNSENGSKEVLYSGNGSLVKYVNGNGSGNGAAVKAEVVEVVTEESKEDGRKRRVEEIGKEDAWFKQNGAEQVEVSFRYWQRLKAFTRKICNRELGGYGSCV